MKRQIRVTGKGHLSLKPDLVCIELECEDVFDRYSLCVEESKKETAVLRLLFEKLGFSNKDLKTTYFSIDTDYQQEYIKDHYERIFNGYKYSHNYKVECDIKQDLSKILYSLSHCPIKPEIHLTYTVKDKEKAKNKLLEKAVEDSMNKAQILAKASKVSLGDIISIDYSWGEIEMISHPVGRVLYDSAPTSSFDIEPDDIDVSDTVTIVYEIG